jgi:hypothetical protein
LSKLWPPSFITSAIGLILRPHHDAGSDVEDLDDVGRLAGAEGGDAGVQGFRVGSLVDRDDLVVALGGVEFLREVLDRLVVGAGHRVPPLDLGLGLGRNRRGARHGDKGERRCGERRVNAVHLSRLPDLRIVVMLSDPQ